MTTRHGPGLRWRRTSPAVQLLLAATAAACRPGPHQRVVDLVAHAGPDVSRDLPGLAIAHRVDGCVHDVLEHVEGVDRAALGALAASRRQSATHHLLVRDALSRVAAVLDAAGIPWLVFKGPVLSSAIYCGPGLRRYSDLDVLVQPDHFAAAVQALEAAGHHNPVTSWSPQLYFRSGAIAFEVNRIGVDLHWHVTYKYQDRRWYRIDPALLFERRRAVDVGGRQVATFDAVDTLFHLALHAAREGCHRLVWLKDIERAVAVDRPDLDELVRRSRAARCAPAIGIALARSKWALGTDVPDRVVADLVGRLWPPVVRAAVAFDDLASTRERRSVATFLTAETRMSLPRTAVRAVRRIGDRRREDRVDRDLQRGFDPDTASPAHRAANDADRAAYLALVRDWRSELG